MLFEAPGVLFNNNFYIFMYSEEYNKNIEKFIHQFSFTKDVHINTHTYYQFNSSDHFLIAYNIIHDPKVLRFPTPFQTFFNMKQVDVRDINPNYLTNRFEFNSNTMLYNHRNIINTEFVVYNEEYDIKPVIGKLIGYIPNADYPFIIESPINSSLKKRLTSKYKYGIPSNVFHLFRPITEEEYKILKEHLYDKFTD